LVLRYCSASSSLLPFFFSLLRRPPLSPLFPYTTLFRSSPLRRRLPSFSRSALRPATTTPSRPPPFASYIAASALAMSSSGVSPRSEEHTSELQSHLNLVCRLLLEKKKKKIYHYHLHTHV